ncbi:TPA: hypothetical protein TY903_000600 [Streptococcus suis]|nr:hypothetical protein [Streptococcus suis]
MKMRVKEILDNINIFVLTPYEREQLETVDKLTNLRILNTREYFKSSSVAQRVRTTLRFFFCVFIVPLLTWLGVLIPEKASNSVPLMIIFIVLGLAWLFIIFYYVCNLLLLLIGFRTRIFAVFLSWVVNAYLSTHLLFNSTLLAEERQIFLQKLLTVFVFTAGKYDFKDFWSIFLITIIPLLCFVVLSLGGSKIYELEKIKIILDLISIFLALSTFVFNISYKEVTIVGQLQFYLLIETLSSSIIISYKMKKMQEEAEKILRKEILRIHPVYANLKRCYVVGGEAYKDKMLSNEKMYRTILRNESAIVCNAKRLKIIVSNPKRCFNKSTTIKLKHPTVWIVKEELLKSFFERKNSKPSASKWTRLKLWVASFIGKQTR